ncbi:TonB-dependent receptor [Acidobacteria bacterium AH-259-O06]|nr:TonB-dependent receptor [Acidobacteria bacterium AH-259-O06]
MNLKKHPILIRHLLGMLPAWQAARESACLLMPRCIQTLTVCLLATSLSLAQDSGIQGAVTDETGAVIPGAEVTVTNLQTGIGQTVITSDVGFYSVPLLKEGQYKVQCSMPGFATQESQMRLEVGQVARMDFQLNVGEVTEVVEVFSVAPLLQTKTTDVGQVIDEKRIRELPLNGRNYLELAQLTAGVLPARQLGRGHRAGEEGSFLAMGVHVAQNNVLLDGADNSSRTSGGPLGFEAQAVKPPVDAVSEFKVITNNTSAEHGFRMGAKVLVSTKSGTNEYHGSLYEFHRNDDVLGANNFFANRAGAEKPKFIRNQFGGTFGGPIIEDRTFFFASYQGTRIRRGLSFTSTVPSQALREGDFSQEPIQRRNIFDPLTLTGSGKKAIRQQFPNNRIPADRMDPIAMKVMALYPLPNIAGRENKVDNYFFAPSDTNDTDQYDFRVDHNFNDFQRIFVRYSLRDQFKNQPGPLPFPAMGGTGQTVVLEGQNIGANYSVTFNPRTHNEFRFGWTWFPTLFDIPFKENFNKKLGIKGAPGDTFGDGLDHGLALFQPSGYAQVGPRGFWPNQNELKIFNMADNVLLERGSHSIKLGGEFRWTNVLRIPQRHRRGRFRFRGAYTAERPNVGKSRANTGNGLADMMLGWADFSLTSTSAGEEIIAPYYALYIQDDWRITPKLTLNLGLRWELFDGPFFPDPEDQVVSRFSFTGTWPDIEFQQWAAPKDGSDCACKRDLNNFGPRVGIAYRLADKTVIRTGGGIYYGEADYISSEVGRFQNGPPKRIEIRDNQSRETTTLFVQEGFKPLPQDPDPTVIPSPGTITATLIPEFLPTQYVAQWFFDVQHTLPSDTVLTVGYDGSASSHLSTSRNINAPLTPHATKRWQSRRRYKPLNRLILYGNILNSNYNAFTLKVEKRYSGGLTFLNSFTWAHNIDYGNERLNQNLGGRASQYDLGSERGSSGLDRRFGNTLAILYELPFGPDKTRLQSGPLKWILGGWQVGGILSLLAGMPVDHSINVDNQNNNGRARGDWVRDPNLPASQRSIDQWFDTEFVVASAPAVIGNAGRNLIEGPGRKNFDFIAMKNFAMPWEDHRLQFRFEAFNFTNTPHFGTPNTSVGRAAAGRINRAEVGRLIQFALKYVF